MTVRPEAWASRWGVPLAVLALVVLLHAVASPAGEPWKNNDETRHVMTGVFVRDAIFDLPASARDPGGYAGRYYKQLPALGLLVWPPLFYLVEGVVMAALGPSYPVARLVLSAFAVWAFVESRTLLRRAMPGPWANVALALTACGPLVVDFSRFVLLEVPTLALVLASANRFEQYLSGARGRVAVLACLLAAGAALTRFDGVVLLAYFLIRLAAERKLALLVRRPVVLGVAAAVALTLPYYLFTWREYRPGVEAAAATGTASYATGLLALDNFWLYPAFAPRQVGRFVTLAAAVGFVAARARWRGPAGPLAALVLGTYLTFVPFADPEPRHAIYWVPGVCGFAALGLKWLADRRGPRAGAAAVFLTVLSTGWQATWEDGWYVTGYGDAARYVLSHRETDRPVLFDGVLAGGFVYQVRLADPDRRVRVLRGDKLLYAVLSDPHGGYREFAATDADVHARLHAADPEFIVVESPEPFGQETPAGARLRAVLATNPDRYRLVAVQTFGTNHDVFRAGRLLIYRKLRRNPAPDDGGQVPVLGLGRGVG